MTTPLNLILARIAVYTEKYVLPVVYLSFATSHFKELAGILSGRLLPENSVFVDATHQLTLLLLSVVTSLLLLFARRAAVPPKQFKLILIPLVTAFFNFVYYTVPLFPKSWQAKLCPAEFQIAFFTAGLSCIIVGPLFSLWGLLHLGRSFGVFVTLRKVVVTGPYKWVRHPMYLGWVCLFVGFALANFSWAYLLLVIVHITLILYRANLEETQLAMLSEEYRQYTKRTPFIFPKLRRSPGSAPKAKY